MAAERPSGLVGTYVLDNRERATRLRECAAISAVGLGWGTCHARFASQRGISDCCLGLSCLVGARLPSRDLQSLFSTGLFTETVDNFRPLRRPSGARNDSCAAGGNRVSRRFWQPMGSSSTKARACACLRNTLRLADSTSATTALFDFGASRHLRKTSIRGTSRYLMMTREFQRSGNRGASFRLLLRR